MWWHPWCINTAIQAKLLFTRPGRNGCALFLKRATSTQRFYLRAGIMALWRSCKPQYHYFHRSRDRRNVPHISIREYSYANGHKFPHSEPGFAPRSSPCFSCGRFSQRVSSSLPTTQIQDLEGPVGYSASISNKLHLHHWEILHSQLSANVRRRFQTLCFDFA